MSYDPHDVAFLRQNGICPSKVNRSFFTHSVDWRCPVCGIGKYELVHRRANGSYFSGIECHHYGAAPGDPTYWNKAVYVCFRCNSREAMYRKQHALGHAMSVEEMRQAFGERHAVVPCLHGGPFWAQKHARFIARQRAYVR